MVITGLYICSGRQHSLSPGMVHLNTVTPDDSHLAKQIATFHYCDLSKNNDSCNSVPTFLTAYTSTPFHGF